MAVGSFAMNYTNYHWGHVVLLTLMSSGEPCGTAIAALAAVRFPPQNRGLALSLTMMMFRVGALVGTYLVDAIVLDGLCTELMFVCGGLSVCKCGGVDWSHLNVNSCRL